MPTVRPRARQKPSDPTNPRARRDGLLVQELPDETLVYDLERNRAHCLNRTAALVWRHCDGNTRVVDLAQLLPNSVDLPASEDVVWLALNRLGRAHLLEAQVARPDGGRAPSRREILGKLGSVGGLAILLPAVQSIVAPDVVQAASGVTAQACWRNPSANAGKCCIDTNPRRICRNIAGFGLCWGSPC